MIIDIMIESLKISPEYYSKYITEGRFVEKFVIKSLEYDFNSKEIEGVVEFLKYQKDVENYNNPLGVHLSHQSCLDILYQSMVVAFCSLKKESKFNLGEFIGKSISFISSKPVNLEKKIGLIVSLDNLKCLQDKSYIDYLFNIGNYDCNGCLEESFVGSGSGVLPFDASNFL